MRRNSWSSLGLLRATFSVVPTSGVHIPAVSENTSLIVFRVAFQKERLLPEMAEAGLKPMPMTLHCIGPVLSEVMWV